MKAGFLFLYDPVVTTQECDGPELCHIWNPLHFRRNHCGTLTIGTELHNVGQLLEGQLLDNLGLGIVTNGGQLAQELLQVCVGLVDCLFLQSLEEKSLQKVAMEGLARVSHQSA